MKLKYKIKFRLEQRHIIPEDKTSDLTTENLPILVDFTFERKRFKTSIGYRIDLDKWDAEKQQVIPNTYNKSRISATTINQRISDIKTHLGSIYTEYSVLKKDITVKMVNEALKDKLNDVKVQAPELEKTIPDYIQLFLDTESKKKEWSEGTKKKFSTIKTHITGYCEKHNCKLYFNDITADFLQSYKDYQRTILKLNNTTNLKYMKLFKWFMNWATKNKYNSNLEYKDFEFKFKGTATSDYQKNIIFLSWKELQHFINFDFSDNKQLGQVRDIYCFCSLTSLRYSDIEHLKKSDFKKDDNENTYIEIFTMKTDDKLNIELNKYALAIWEKYKGIDLKNNRAFPVLSNQKYNEYLKKAGEKAEFNSIETYIEYRGNKRTETTYKKWELLTTHTARKTFIINALYLGIQPDIIRAWTGHKDLRTMEVYTKIVNEQKRIEMDKFNKI